MGVLRSVSLVCGAPERDERTPRGAGGHCRSMEVDQSAPMPVLELTDLVRGHQVGLWRYLRFLGCPDHEIEDVLQETFLGVWRRPFEVRSDAATARYLRRAAQSHFLMKMRKTRREPPTRDLEEAETVWARCARTDDGALYTDALRACLRRLDAKARRALDIRYGSNGDRAEIAAEFGMSPGGVKTLLRRARQRLRACIRARMAS
jgi:RNA polymerase sigma-70 factor (ECF subfamily)